MGRRFVFCTWVLAVVIAVMPRIAYAAGELRRPVTGPSLTRFGVLYTGPGGAVTHRGLDLSAEAGDDVLAAVAGTVTFAGEVPAAGGGRTTAVTISTFDGLQVTVMPLERSFVRQGDGVTAGMRLGMLAGSGDASSAESHVHLSVRQDGAYQDPEPMLMAVDDGPVPVPSGGTETVGRAGAVARSGVSVAEVSGTRVSATSGAGQATARVGYQSAAAPYLSAGQAEVLRDAFSAEIGRLRSGHGRIRTSGFAEPTLADMVRAAVAGERVPFRPRAAVAWAAAVAALAGAGVCVRRVPMRARALSRTT